MTDRDHKYISNLYNSIFRVMEKYKNENDYEIMVVVRNSDTLCIKKWNEYKDVKLRQVSHYEIKNRHNIHKIAEKRNIVRKYALLHNFDYLWFIDSDILVKDTCLGILLEGIKYGNISYIPYNIKWVGFPIIGIIEKNQLNLLKISGIDLCNPYKICHFVGFGMTLLDKSTLNFDIKYDSINIADVKHEGEDFGFCLQMLKEKKVIICCCNHIVEHLEN